MNPGEELSSLSFDKIIGGTLDAVVKAQSCSSISTINFIKNAGFRLNDRGETIEPIYVGFKYPHEVKPYQPERPASRSLKINNGGEGYSDESVKQCTVGGKKVNVRLAYAGGRIVSAELLEELDAQDGAAVNLELNDGVQVSKSAQISVTVRAAMPATAAQYENMELKVPILTMLPIPYIRVASTDIEFNVKINSIANTSSSEEDKKEMGGSASFGYNGFGVSASVNFNASMSHQKKTSSTEEVKKEYSLNIKVHAVQDDMPAGISRILDILEEAIVPKHSEKAA